MSFSQSDSSDSSEVFEGTSENLAAHEEKIVKKLEVEVCTTTTMAPKSTTKSITSYKSFCMKRIKDVNDAVKKKTDKTLALKQIERLEAIRDKLVEQKIGCHNHKNNLLLMNTKKLTLLQLSMKKLPP